MRKNKWEQKKCARRQWQDNSYTNQSGANKIFPKQGHDNQQNITFGTFTYLLRTLLLISICICVSGIIRFLQCMFSHFPSLQLNNYLKRKKNSYLSMISSFSCFIVFDYMSIIHVVAISGVWETWWRTTARTIWRIRIKWNVMKKKMREIWNCPMPIAFQRTNVSTQPAWRQHTIFITMDSYT